MQEKIVKRLTMGLGIVFILFVVLSMATLIGGSENQATSSDHSSVAAVVKTGITAQGSVTSSVKSPAKIGPQALTEDHGTPTAHNAFPTTAPRCGQTLLPFGTKDQTIRCDGRNWVADSYLQSFGNDSHMNVHVGDNWSSPYNAALQSVVWDSQKDIGVLGYVKNPINDIGAGVKGSSETGIGVLGTTQTNFGLYGLSTSGIGVGAFSGNNIAIWGNSPLGKGILAKTDSGYGFYQEGDQGTNSFEGSLAVGYFVNPGFTAPGVKIKAKGGIQIETVQQPPICDEAVRGTFWFIKGTTGTKDTAQVCAKDASDNFAWRTLY